MGSTGLDLLASPVWAGAKAVTCAEARARFDAAPDFTIGIEDEAMLVDPITFELSPVIDDVLAAVDGDERFTRELRKAQLEIVTPVCESVCDAIDELADARRKLVQRVDGGVRLVSAGTHPFSSTWGEITEGERYRQIADEYTWAARRSLACGLHVHVAVPGADRALAVYNALRAYLPDLAALATNSPYVDGRDSGLCSIRPKLNEAFPRAGTPPAFASWEEMIGFIDWGRAGGLFPDGSHFWWDLRPHLEYGTLELRVADSQTRLEHAGAVAAVFQALVVHLAERHAAGEELRVCDSYRINENAWRAYRYGIRGSLVDLATGEPRPARERLADLFDELEPSIRRLGAQRHLEDARVLLVGNGAELQRYVAEREGMTGLVAWLARETEKSALEW